MKGALPGEEMRVEKVKQHSQSATHSIRPALYCLGSQHHSDVKQTKAQGYSQGWQDPRNEHIKGLRCAPCQVTHERTEKHQPA